MLLKELIRFSTQHRTLYCYMVLSIWIFLLIAGMYKYIGSSGAALGNGYLSGSRQDSFLSAEAAAAAAAAEEEQHARQRRFKERCTPLDQLTRHDDGGMLEGWKLQGVLLVIRHGDRGPMSHVRAVSTIDCGVIGDALVNRYRSFLHNSTSTSGANHMYWNKVGPFHSFALLPATERSCLLGQLTYKGIAQLLHVGDMLHQIYAHPLGLLHRTAASAKAANSYSTPHSLLNSDEVVLYSTRYRRTFQSAMALLFALLPADKWLALNVRESHSMGFCFTDCTCAKAEQLRRRLSALNAEHLTQHVALSAVIQRIGATLLQHTPNGGANAAAPTLPTSDPNEVVDAALTLLCHNAPLPCRRLENNGSVRLVSTTPASTADLSEFINIDQDDVAAAANSQNEANAEGAAMSDEAFGGAGGGGAAESCIEPAHIAALMSYAQWQSAREAQHAFYKRIGLMRAYGMIRHIVSHMLKMISGDRTKLVLYSGHDWTLQYLTAALGLRAKHTFVPYAARLAFEVYRSEMHTDYYFRVVYQGRDVTQQIDFCEGGKSLRVTRDSRGNKADLCPIENIIRFLHEDYFAPLNATNFKDACATAQKANEF